MSKSAAILALDEALTAAGHDPECAAYEPGCPCSGPPVCSGDPIPEIAQLPQPTPPPTMPRTVSVSDIRTSEEPSITLVGPACFAYLRYRAAANALLIAQGAYKTAQDEFTAAHQSFADAIARQPG